MICVRFVIIYFISIFVVVKGYYCMCCVNSKYLYVFVVNVSYLGLYFFLFLYVNICLDIFIKGI